MIDAIQFHGSKSDSKSSAATSRPSAKAYVVKAASRHGVQEETRLARMMARKPKMLVAIALANRMARAIWAMLSNKKNYRQPVASV